MVPPTFRMCLPTSINTTLTDMPRGYVVCHRWTRRLVSGDSKFCQVDNIDYHNNTLFLICCYYDKIPYKNSQSEERVYLAYDFQFIVHQWRVVRTGTQARTWSRNRGGMLPSGSLPGSLLASFLTQPKTTYLENGTNHSKLGSPTSINNQNNPPQANLM